MSKIRDEILRGEPATGSIDDLGEWLLELIKSWTPVEKTLARAQLNFEYLEKLSGHKWIN
jgi:hypothetical protein